MANAKFYENTAGANVWQPAVGSILHIRNNEVLHDYADTRVSEADYGNGLKEALSGSGPTTLTQGDVVLVGPGKFAVDGAVCAVNGVDIRFGRTVLAPATAGYSSVIGITGDECTMSGLVVKGSGLLGTGNANGIYINGNSCTVTNCESHDHTTSVGTNGVGFLVDNCTDVVLNGCLGNRNHYCAIHSQNVNRLTVKNSTFKNNGNGAGTARTVQVEGSLSSSQFFKYLNNTHYCETANTSSLMNFNQINGIDTILIDGCTLTDNNSVSLANRVQMIKVQDCRNLRLSNTDIRHGENTFSSSYNVWALAFDNAPDDSIEITGCSFSDGLTFPLGTVNGHILVERNAFGVDRNEFSWMLGECGDTPLFTVRNNHFTVHNRRIFTFQNQAVPTTNIFEFYQNAIVGDVSTGHMNLADDGFGPALYQYPRKIRCYDNHAVNNDATYDFRYSDYQGAAGNQELNLMLQTDAVGDMRFDDTQIGTGMPTPGVGPSYFSSNLKGSQGTRIWNINWSPTDTQVTPERGWIQHGGVWAEIT